MNRLQFFKTIMVSMLAWFWVYKSKLPSNSPKGDYTIIWYELKNGVAKYWWIPNVTDFTCSNHELRNAFKIEIQSDRLIGGFEKIRKNPAGALYRPCYFFGYEVILRS